jgi:drug/metabolite transporter (DMT)-like permease
MTIAATDFPLHRLGVAAGLFGVLNLSLMIVVGRLGVVGDTLTIFDQAGLRFATAALCVLPLLVRSWPWGLSLKRHLVLSTFGGAPFVLLLFAGMEFAPVAHAAIVVNGLLPLMAAIVTWLWLRQAPGRWQVAGIVIAGLGVLLVGWEALAFGVAGQWRGHLLFAATALSIAIWYGAMRQWRISIPQMFAGTLVLNAMVYVPLWLLLLPSSVSTAPMQDILVQAVILGVWGAVLGGYAQAYAARAIGPTRQGAIMSGGPALATLIAIPVLAEYPSLLAVLGIVVVAAGVLATVLSGLRADAR